MRGRPLRTIIAVCATLTTVAATFAATEGVAAADVDGFQVLVSTPGELTAGGQAATFSAIMSNALGPDETVQLRAVFTGSAALAPDEVQLGYESDPAAHSYTTVTLAGASAGTLTGTFPAIAIPLLTQGHTSLALRLGVTGGIPIGTLTAEFDLIGAGNTLLARGGGDIDVSSQFSDVGASTPFASEIDELAAEHVIDGYPDGTFRPNGYVSRDAFAGLLARVLGLPVGPCTSGTSPFRDVPRSNAFCTAIAAMAAAHIIRGYPDGTFRPGATIARQAIAAYLARADGWLRAGKSASGALDHSCTRPIPFTDVRSSNPFCGDIEWLAAHGIALGYSNGTFGGTGLTTRGATAALLVRFQQYENLQTCCETVPPPGGGGAGVHPLQR